jgi:hypothetical protein
LVLTGSGEKEFFGWPRFTTILNLKGGRSQKLLFVFGLSRSY